MPEYDAFGREVGENTLAGLGGDPAAEPRPAPPTPPTVSAAAADRPAGRPRRGVRGLGCLLSLAFLAVVLAGPVIALVGFVDDAADTVTDVRDDIEGAADPGQVAATPEARPPTGLKGRSMLRAQNLAKALAVLRAQDAGKPARIIVRPDRVDGDLTRGERRRNVVVTFDAELRRGDPVDVGVREPALAWGRIDPAVPARFVKSAAGRFGVRPERIDYVIGEPDVFDREPLRWVAYFKNGVIVQGDERGRVERRIS